MNSPASRISLLSPLVIDQIAAGEVVERPASVVKELVDNSLDAGSTRIDVELEDGGLTRISVRDNGRGIHPEDLVLAVTRHATSKLRDATDLADIRTLGFRGEALASVAAVARVDIRSRPQAATVGTHLHSIPGEPPTLAPAGLPVGTQVEVHALFANVPARRKFMRAEATEVGQCSETLLRLAIVHPEVHFTLRHGKRELLNLPRATLEGRIAQVLERRVAGPFFAFAGEDDGVAVHAFLPHPSAAARGRGSPYLITRRRVVKERSLAQILSQAYALSGEAPSACLIVEPPPATVDVNVHPQKAEVRFSEPQQVYAAVRRVLAAAVAAAPWAAELAPRPSGSELAPRPSGSELAPRPSGSELAPRPSGSEFPGRSEAPGLSVQVPGDMPGEPARSFLPVGFARDHAGARAPAPAEAPDDDDSPAPGLPPGAGPPPAPADALDRSRSAREPGPAARRAAQAATRLAAERQASADAWLARAEAAVDAADDSALAAATARDPAPTPRPAAASPVVAADDAEPWDLDVAGPRSPDLSSETSTAADRDDMSSEPASRRADGWVARAGAATDADPAVAAADAWLERAGAEAEAPLLRWSEQQPEPPPSKPAPEDRPAGGGYRLSTRALGPDYDRHKRDVMHAAAALRPVDAPARPEPAGPEPALSLPNLPESAPAPQDMREASGPIGQAPRQDIPALLACLPGPVAVFADRDALLAVDLRRIRSHLVFLRLQRDLIGRRAVAVQGLLTPAVVRRPTPDVALLTGAQSELLTLGVDVEAFGDDAVLVRGVPAHLRHCVDDADAADLVARIVPWLRIRASDGDRAARERGLLDAIATTRGGDPAPRLARRWLAELLDAGGSLESIPGIRRWTSTALLGGE